MQQSSDRTSQTVRELHTAKYFGNFVDARMLNVDPLGEVYVIDRGRSGAIKFSKDLDSVAAVAGVGRDHRQFDEPVWLDARQSNSLAVADERNHRVEIYSRDLAYVATLTTRDNPIPEKRFGFPKSVAVDNAGNLFVVDGESHRVLKFRRDLQFEGVLGAFAQASGARGKLTDPIAVASDDEGAIAVLDLGGRELVSYDALGNAMARITLTNQASRLHTRNDTLFVLSNLVGLARFGSVLELFGMKQLNLLATLVLPIVAQDAIPWKSEFIVLGKQSALVAH